MVALENLSTIICPVYGDFYSFPWKRGPHDSILEYIEAQKHFENLRQKIYFELKEQDLIAKALMIYFKEEDPEKLEVRCSTLRFLNQLLKSFDISQPKGERAIELFISDKSSVNLISQIGFSAQDDIL